MSALLRFEGVALRRGGRLLFEDLDLELGAGRGAAGRGPERQRQIEPDPARRGPAASRARARSSASPLALADDHLALDRELPLRRALASGAARSTRRWTRSASRTWRDVPVRLLSSGQRKRATLARVAASGAPLWLLDEPLNALDADGADAARARSIAAHRATRRRGACRVAPAARPATGAGWSSADDRRADRCATCGAASTGAAWLPIAFFLLVATLVPFAVGPDARLLARIGAGRAVDRRADRRAAADRAAGRARSRRRRARPARASRHRRGERRRRQDRRALADLRAAAAARGGPGLGAAGDGRRVARADRARAG